MTPCAQVVPDSLPDPQGYAGPLSHDFGWGVWWESMNGDFPQCISWAAVCSVPMLWPELRDLCALSSFAAPTPAHTRKKSEDQRSPPPWPAQGLYW